MPNTVTLTEQDDDYFLSPVDVPAVIYAFAGNDNVVAGIRDDTIYGMDGNDTLWGEAGDDSLFGGEGDDYLIGHIGADHFDGGNGYDSVVYYYSTAGLTADLLIPSLNTGEAAGDT